MDHGEKMFSDYVIESEPVLVQQYCIAHRRIFFMAYLLQRQGGN